MTDISIIITSHKEGLLLGHAIKSCLGAVELAKGAGISTELILINDKSDENTKAMCDADSLAGLLGIDCQVFQTEYGDPGLSRNHGVSNAKGRFVTFLDGDDLWGRNWLVNCHRFMRDNPMRLVGHSAMNLVFGNNRILWFHPSTLDKDLDLRTISVNNYWDSMAFADRSIYVDFPFIENDIKFGFGHEDWHWNCVTLRAGIHHVPVPETIHFKRARSASQMSLCNVNDVIIRKTDAASAEGHRETVKALQANT